MPVITAPFYALVFRSSVMPLRMQIDADWTDLRGGHYYPAVHLQYRAWNDDSATAWTPLLIDDYAVVADTIIIHLDRLLVIDAQMAGANFSFRARLSSAGVHTDWARLPESIRFYSTERPGIPQQPRALKLLPP